MPQVTCIIVDDDTFSAKIMSGYVRRTNDVGLAQTFSNAIDAINFLSGREGKNVNLIFLDIEMPEMSGMEFMRSIDLSGKEVVIYSSQEKYALESYEYDVCDYLLKPVSYARFIRSVGKARMALEIKEEEADEEPADDSECAFLRDNAGVTHKVRYDDIVMIEALENYVSVCTPRHKILIHSPLRKLVDTLPPQHVVRVHRSYAIGMRHICNVEKDKVVVELGREKVELPLSRVFGQDLRKRIEALQASEAGKNATCAE